MERRVRRSIGRELVRRAVMQSRLRGTTGSWQESSPRSVEPFNPEDGTNARVIEVPATSEAPLNEIFTEVSPNPTS